MSQYDTITGGIVQKPPFNLIVYLELWYEFRALGTSKFTLWMYKYMNSCNVLNHSENAYHKILWVNIIPEGIVQRAPFNLMAYLKLRVWVLCSQHIQAHYVNVQIHKDQGTALVWVAMFWIVIVRYCVCFRDRQADGCVRRKPGVSWCLPGWEWGWETFGSEVIERCICLSQGAD